MSADNQLLATLSGTIRGLMAATLQLQEDTPVASYLDNIIKRGDFRPTEDEAIGFWFARFLTLREGLRDVISDVRNVSHKEDFRYFLVGYAAVCLLIRIDRILLFQVASHSTIQRKLNEAFPEYRIPRKQYTEVFSAFVDQSNVLAIRDAMQFAKKNRRALLGFKNDDCVGFIAQRLDELETSLNKSKLSYARRVLSYISHKWRRRGVVSVEKTLATVLEGFGRVASEFCEMENKQVTANVLQSIADFLEPGDVIVTRHAKALTNLFFPGFWPHAALYIGTDHQRRAAGISADTGRASRWIDGNCVLEARKDGVLFRPLDDTLSVDAFIVLRPNIASENVAVAIQRAILHEGKKYNFDFDFFNSDRIVCTELIYRAYDGLENIQFLLQERAGRKTLSAEDLLDFAIDSGAFTPVAIFGTEPGTDVVYGNSVPGILAASYRGR